jgi:hypothetical protein
MSNVTIKPRNETDRLRRVEVYRDGKWKRCRLQDIVKGDVFRMFEPDCGSPVHVDGQTEWTALGDAVLIQDRISVKV